MKSLYLNGTIFTEKDVELLKGKRCGMFSLEEDYAKRAGLRGNETLEELVKKFCVPPLGAETIFDVFGKYGYTICGICEGFRWKDELKNVSELDAWKMIALSCLYWEAFYKELCERKESDDEG